MPKNGRADKLINRIIEVLYNSTLSFRLTCSWWRERERESESERERDGVRGMMLDVGRVFVEAPMRIKILLLEQQGSDPGPRVFAQNVHNAICGLFLACPMLFLLGG